MNASMPRSTSPNVWCCCLFSCIFLASCVCHAQEGLNVIDDGTSASSQGGLTSSESLGVGDRVNVKQQLASSTGNKACKKEDMDVGRQASTDLHQQHHNDVSEWWSGLFLIFLALFLGVSTYILAVTSLPQIRLEYTHTPKNIAIVRGCPNLMHGFRPAPPLLDGHTQTLSVLFRSGPTVIYDRETVPTPDGGHFSLDWISRTSHDTCPSAHDASSKHEKSILVIMHGLTGGSQESYVRSLGDYAARRANVRVVVMNNRGCAGSTLATPQVRLTACFLSWSGLFVRDV
jgi:hypothetical protein